MRISIDIGFLAQLYASRSGKNGLYRVIDSIVPRLREHTEIDIRLVSVCGAEPLYQDLFAREYLQRETGSVDDFESAWYSRRRMETLYRLAGPPYVRAVRSGRRSLWKVVTRTLAARDIASRIPSPEPDVFVSTYLRLPDSLPAHVSRVLWIYDLTLLSRPQWFPEDWVTSERARLDNLDPNRDFLICNTEFVAGEFVSLVNFPRERIRVVPLGVDESLAPVDDLSVRRRVRERYVPGETPFILSLAQFKPNKNVPNLVDAFARRARAHPKSRLDLVFAGSDDAAARELCAKLPDSVRDRVRFAGYVAESDLATLYGCARIFAFPSLAEGFGLPPLEAMRCGTPTLVSRRTCLPEATGGLAVDADPNDPGDIAAALWRLHTDESLRERLAADGRVWAETFT